LAPHSNSNSSTVSSIKRLVGWEYNSALAAKPFHLISRLVSLLCRLQTSSSLLTTTVRFENLTTHVHDMFLQLRSSLPVFLAVQFILSASAAPLNARSLTNELEKRIMPPLKKPLPTPSSEFVAPPLMIPPADRNAIPICKFLHDTSQ
jgi:hypothetical protein